MENKPNSIDLSYINLFKYFTNIYHILLLISGIFLFDSLEIMVFQIGILDTDFSNFINFSMIPFFLLFFTVFGVVSLMIHSLADYSTSKIYDHIFYKHNKKRYNFYNIDFLYENALITENNFLFEYIKENAISNKNIRRNILHTYSFLFVIIINSSVTRFYNSKTLIKYIFYLYTNKNDILIKLFSFILIILVCIAVIVGIVYSVSQYQFEIYFPDEKYKLLEEEKKSLLNKK